MTQDFWPLVDSGAWEIATHSCEAYYSNTCRCGAFIDRHRATVSHTTWGKIHMIIDQGSELVSLSLREFVDMNPGLFASLKLPGAERSEGCSLCRNIPA